MWIFLLACKGTPDDTSDTSDTGVVDDTGDVEHDATWHCPDETPQVTAGEHTDWVVTTAHYALEVDGTQAWATQLGLMAEASWLAYGEWFGAEPAETPLRAGFYGSQGALQAAMQRDGQSPASSAGYYAWDSQTAYTSDQPTDYYDQVLFLHELAHQWHHLGAGASGGQADWFAEGLAETLSRHDWDGACLRVARRPLLSQEDFAAVALQAVDAHGSDVNDWIANDTWPGQRPLWFAVFRWMLETDPEGLQAFRAAYDADGSLDVPAALGDLDGDAFHDWLRSDQEPMTPVWIEWTHLSSDSVRGFAEYNSIARVKQPGDRFSATLQVPAQDYWAGVVLGWESTDEYTVLYVDQDGALFLGETLGGALTFWDAGAIPAPSGSLDMSVTWDGDQPVVQLGADTVQPELVHAPGAGLVVYGADVVFTEIAP